jgi:hypothetical protein
MGKKVTDPLLLMQLNGDVQMDFETPPTPEEMAAIQADAEQEMQKRKKVTDPMLLAQLNGERTTIDPSEGVGPGDAMLIGAGKTLSRIGQGMQQGYYGMTGNQPELDRLSQQVSEENQLYAPLQKQHPFATAIGESLPSMAIPGASATRMVAAGALPGLLEYGSGEERLTRGAAGGAGGLLGYGVGKTVGRINKPFSSVDDPLRNEMVSKAGQYGIPLSAAQKTGNTALRWIDSALDNLPFTADRQAVQKGAQQKAFNRAAGGMVGADADNLTPEVLNSVKQTLGSGFNDLASRNRLNFDNATLQSIADAKMNLQRYETGDVQMIASNYLDDIMTKVEPDGTISGDAYRKWDSAISKQIRNTNNGDLRYALSESRDIIRNAMDDSISPADSAAWRDLRKKYAQTQILADVTKNTATGDVSPASLLQAVNRQSKNAKFSGGGELGDLARVGKETLQKLPDSGTAQRSFWMNALTGGGLGAVGVGGLAGLISPLTLAGAAAGAATPLAIQKAMWGGPGAKWMTQGLLDISPELANDLLRASALSGMSASNYLE